MQFVSKVKFEKKVSIKSNVSCRGIMCDTGEVIDFSSELFNKLINIKIPRIGNIHISGAKKDLHIFKAFKYIISYIKGINENHNVSIFSIIKGKKIRGIINRIMTNVKSNCNFIIKRENLNLHIPEIIPSSTSFFDPSLRYPGVKITLNIDMPCNAKSTEITMKSNGSCKIKNISYMKYIEYVKKIDSNKKFKNFVKTVKFMVFKKGVIIITSPYQDMIPKLLDYFLRSLKLNRELIEYL